jgi:biopolymer transport protein ExbD
MSTASENDVLTAAQRSKIRRLSQPKELSPEDEAGELNIVPFLDIITNVLMFVLASLAVTFTLELTASPPQKPQGGFRQNPTEASLNLAVMILPNGYFVKGKGGSYSPGCKATVNGGSAPPTVPLISATAAESVDGKKFDPDSLKECLVQIKSAFPDESQVILIANPDVPAQEIVRVMDVVRDYCLDKGKSCTEGKNIGELFPNILFGVLN